MSDSCIDIQNIAYKEAGPDYHTRPHRKKDALQWYCVVYGRVDMVVDDISTILNPADAILIHASSVRSPCCLDSQAPGYLISDFINHSLALDSIINRRIHVPAEIQPDLRSLAQELRGHPEPDTLELTLALLIRILIGLCRTSETDSSTTLSLNAGHHHEIIRRAEVFMRRNLHRPLSRSDIARSVHFSAPHLARIFRSHTDKTVTERLTELRVTRAKQLLLETTMPITQICFDVGYDSFSHFSKVFKGHVGVRPSDYRKSEGMVWRNESIKNRDTFIEDSSS